MNYHHANLSCVLKVEPRCDACKRQAMEVLGSIDGVYDVTIDSETKTATIMGEVDPNFCVKALARCGIHAELIRANITHPKLSRSSYDHDYNYGSYNHNYYSDPYNSIHRRSLPEGMWHDSHPQYPRRILPEYSHNANNYYNGVTYTGRALPEYSHNTNYYYPSADEGHMNMCSIM